MQSAAGLTDIAGLADNSWRIVLKSVLTTPAHTDVSISKLLLPHPLKVDGFVKHLGGFAGQLGNYRFPLPDGREFHVKEYTDTFLAHWDNISATRNPLGHLLKDAPLWMRGGVIHAAAFAVFRSLWHSSKTKRRIKTQRKK